MENNVLLSEIINIAKDVFKNDTTDYSNSTSAKEVEGWTSLSFMKLISIVENKYNFKFSIMEIVEIETLGDIVEVIKSHNH